MYLVTKRQRRANTMTKTKAKKTDYRFKPMTKAEMDAHNNSAAVLAHKATMEARRAEAAPLTDHDKYLLAEFRQYGTN